MVWDYKLSEKCCVIHVIFLLTRLVYTLYIHITDSFIINLLHVNVIESASVVAKLILMHLLKNMSTGWFLKHFWQNFKIPSYVSCFAVQYINIVILFQDHTNKFYLTLKLNQLQTRVQYRRQFSYTAALLSMSSFLSIDLTEMRPLAVIILAWWFLNYVNWSLWLCFNCSTMIYVFHVLFVSQQ